MKQGETLALNERIMLSLVSTGVSPGPRTGPVPVPVLVLVLVLVVLVILSSPCSGSALLSLDPEL